MPVKIAKIKYKKIAYTYIEINKYLVRSITIFVIYDWLGIKNTS